MRAQLSLTIRANRAATCRSSALVIVLFFVALISILLIGYLASMRLERFSAETHLSGVLANIYADAGTRVAVSQLYTATSDPTKSWISQPGCIYSFTGATTVGSASLITNNLSSGTNGIGSGTPSANVAVDLNPVSVPTGGNPMAPATGSLPTTTMYVQWIYQYQDGSFSTNVPAATPASNPVIGRFAYWVDDEATKININTAGDRTAANLTNQSNPNRVSLDVFSTADAQAITNYSSQTNFNSVDEVGRAGVSSTVTQNKFAITSYSHSPDLSMIGAPRILLTTQKWLADANGTTNFIDILTTESTGPRGQAGYQDPGNLFNSDGTFNINATNACNVLNRIVAELTNSAWPVGPGRCFSTTGGGGLVKYSKANTIRNADVFQIAYNIVDYVRGVESTNVVLEPFTDSYSSSPIGFQPWTTTAGGSGRYSYGRRLFVSEMGVAWTNYIQLTSGAYPLAVKQGLAGTPAATQAWFLQGEYYEKLYLPYFPGTSYVDLTKYDSSSAAGSTINVSGPVNNQADNNYYSKLYPIGPITAASVVVGSNGTKLYPGHTVTLKGGPIWMCRTNGATFSYPTNVIFNLSLQHSPNTTVTLKVDNGSIWQATNVPTLTTPGAELGAGGVTSLCVEDPMVNQADVDWHASSPSGSTGNHLDQDGLSPVPSPTYGKPSTNAPEQDADSSGNVTTNYMFVPAPNGTPSNPDGIIHSVGELGFVHTGTDGGAAGVPWRTIHLQPEKNPKFLPDWLILDLFSAPVYTNVVGAASLPYALPYSTNSAFANNTTNAVPNRGGQINLNALITGISTNNAYLATNRTLPLRALFAGAATNTALVSSSTWTNYIDSTTGYLSMTGASSVALNVINGTTASIAATGQNGVNYTNFYHPAQLCEIKGVADGGEGSEAVIRDITGQAAVNSNVFAVYSVGQALKQDPTGAIHVLGERRKETIVERIVTPGSPPTVHFQTVYTKNL